MCCISQGPSPKNCWIAIRAHYSLWVLGPYRAQFATRFREILLQAGMPESAISPVLEAGSKAEAESMVPPLLPPG